MLPIFGLVFFLVFAGAIFYFYNSGRGRTERRVRDIPAFTVLRQAVGLAVEAGTRLQVSLGRGSITTTESAVGFAGLSVLDRIARAASISDRPPLGTSGDGALTILSQDTLQGVYRSLGVENQYSFTAGRLLGVTPFSYAAGTIPVIDYEQVSANVLIGNFGNEVALIADAGARRNSMTIAGTDNLTGQAVIFATAQEPLIGEEAFAGGAYLGANPIHEASLHAQDLFRMILIVVMLLGSLLAIFGFSLFAGGAP